MSAWRKRAVRDGTAWKETRQEKTNVLQEKARPCRELFDEYLLESTKD